MDGDKKPRPVPPPRDTVCVYLDGGTIGGNPGIGIYFSVGVELPNGETRILVKRQENFDWTSNNQAESCALLSALEAMLTETLPPGTRRLRFHSDSRLIVKQFNGEWRRKDSRLSAMVGAADQLANELATRRKVAVEVVWVPRHENVKRLGH